MADKMTLAFIGGGTMAEAILSGVLDKGLAAPDAICVGEPVSGRRDYLSEMYGVNTTSDNIHAVETADMVVLAVKPQQLRDVLGELRGRLVKSQAALSIVAGASIKSISRGLDHEAVIRVMPNTPAQVGEGMSVWTASPGVTTRHEEAARTILRSLGEEMYVSEEKYLDMATALSASGPAYVFLFLESLIGRRGVLGPVQGDGTDPGPADRSWEARPWPRAPADTRRSCETWSHLRVAQRQRRFYRWRTTG